MAAWASSRKPAPPSIYRDARIAPIYEGTNGIQANDLVFRKLGRDGGEAAAAFCAEIEALAAELATARDDDLTAIGTQLAAGGKALQQATDWIAANREREAVAAAAARRAVSAPVRHCDRRLPDGESGPRRSPDHRRGRERFGLLRSQNRHRAFLTPTTCSARRRHSSIR